MAGKNPYMYRGDLIHIDPLAGCDYWLYRMIATHLGLKSLRETLVLGLRLIYQLGHDPALKQLVINGAADLKDDALNRLDRTPKEERPVYEEWDWGVARLPVVKVRPRQFDRSQSAWGDWSEYTNGRLTLEE